MIRILIRQVIDCRHRAPKSLGIADIEPTAELPLLAGEMAVDYGVRIYHARSTTYCLGRAVRGNGLAVAPLECVLPWTSSCVRRMLPSETK